VTLDPVPNAYTYGHTRPFVVLTSGLQSPTAKNRIEIEFCRSAVYDL
jgi:Zn-dependent protease with chaperone function